MTYEDLLTGVSLNGIMMKVSTDMKRNESKIIVTPQLEHHITATIPFYGVTVNNQGSATHISYQHSPRFKSIIVDLCEHIQFKIISKKLDNLS